MEYFTKTQACRLLGITMPTLNLCLKKLREQGHDLTPMRDPYNQHLVLLSSEQIEVVRQFRGAYLARLPMKAIAAPPKLPQLSSPSRSSSESKHSMPQRYSERILLPDGWVSISGFAAQHGIERWDFAKHKKQLCQQGKWWDGRGWVEWALTPAGQRDFIEVFQHHKDFIP